jgi:hypothetical protein
MTKRKAVSTWESADSRRKREKAQADDEEDAILESVRELFDQLSEMITENPDPGAVRQFIAEHRLTNMLPIYRESLQVGDWTVLHDAAMKGSEHLEALLELEGFLPLVNWEFDGGERPLDVAIQYYEEDDDCRLPCIMALLREGATESPFEHDSIHVNIKKVFRAHRRFFNMVDAEEPDMDVLTKTLAEYPFLATCKKDGVSVLEYSRQTGARTEVLALLARRSAHN